MPDHSVFRKPHRQRKKLGGWHNDLFRLVNSKTPFYTHTHATFQNKYSKWAGICLCDTSGKQKRMRLQHGTKSTEYHIYTQGTARDLRRSACCARKSICCRVSRWKDEESAALPWITRTLFSPDCAGRRELHQEDFQTPLVTLSTCSVTHLWAIETFTCSTWAKCKLRRREIMELFRFFSLGGMLSCPRTNEITDEGKNLYRGDWPTYSLSVGKSHCFISSLCCCSSWESFENYKSCIWISF